VERSNREVLESFFAALDGVDVVTGLRAGLTGDPSSMPANAAGDFAAYLDLYDPNVEIDTSGLDMPDVGVLRGIEGLRELWSRWMEGWEHYIPTTNNFSEIGEHVIFDAEIRATGSSSGADVVHRDCQVWTFRDGKVVRWRLFKDRASALASIERG
jgi:ketosteroid isomerase-like protein